MEFVAGAASLRRVRRFVVTELITHGPVTPRVIGGKTVWAAFDTRFAEG